MKRTYGTLALNADRTKWQFTKVEPHVAIKLKHVFPSIPKTEATLFQVKNTQIICADIDWFTSRYAMQISDYDRIALTSGRMAFDEAQAELGRIFAPDYRPAPDAGWRKGKAPRNYQSLFADLAHARKSVLNGDDVGLGKTIQCISVCLKPGTLPAAVVVKTHLQQQWAEKYLEFTSLRTHKVKTRKAYSLPPADVYLFRYTQLSGWVDFFATGFFKSVGYDEIQELRTGAASEKGRAAYVLTDNTEYHTGYSATPIYGYGAEIFNIMRAIDPSVLGDPEDFYREWCDGDKVKNPDALGTYLREQNVFLRRTKKDVGMEMPPVNTIIETVESDSKESDKVFELARKLALRTITGSFMERGTAARELDLMVRQATGVGKAKPVAAYVRILLENNIPVLLCGWHRAVYDIWLAELAEFSPVMYTGSESTAQKAESKRKFQSGESNLMIISHLSGDGLDGMQHRCSTIVFGELSWSSGRHYQLIGRLDRDGQKESVTAIYLVSEDGSDPPMMDIIGLKTSQSSGIVDPGVAVKNSYSDATRLKLLAQQYLTKTEIAAATATAPSDGPEICLPEETPVETVTEWPVDERPVDAVSAPTTAATAPSLVQQPELF
ncbi:SNF2-related protein [Paraburkholderia sp. SARCC-3016]|uniref:SNF2-related protein n=1 Tax=Paraburkholderia sp. SARCC-3016 TaxID=3058611 RepID=UPI00280A2D98|nr:SNF2-related protein [Paraburkholderia sp. SARCC-3016]MDQ7981886.1 SNF2-related protein [Paraburkholderia sp. SARCC-3016]